MKYTFGVMSCKYELKAEDDETAHIAMSVFIGKNIPIVIYSPKEGAISPKEILEKNTGLLNKENLPNLKKSLNKCMDTIKKL